MSRRGGHQQSQSRQSRSCLDCSNEAVHGLDRCVDHICQYSTEGVTCSGARQSGGRWCVNHSCQYRTAVFSCRVARQSGRKCCAAHECVKDKCREPRTASLDGKVEWDLCKKHKCEQRCDLPRRISTNGLAHRCCSLHECLWNDNGVKCIAPVDRNSRFCENHGCEEGVCFNPRAVVRGKSVVVCWAHKRSNEDCSRFYGLKSWYCEHCRCWDVGCRQQRKPGITALRIPHMFCQNHECQSSVCILAKANCPKHSNDVLRYETVPMFESSSRSQAHSVPVEPDSGIS